ncbi:MAG: hypothetical protein LBU19_04890 [Treponema sp.]|jgi:hypothetical protein|nr:hypothetical protein [Treponema sp.]
MALPAEVMHNVPTIEEFWAAFTKSQEDLAKRQEELAKWQAEEAMRREELAKRQEEEARRREEGVVKLREEAAKRREEEDAKFQKKLEHSTATWEAAHEKTERGLERMIKTVNRVGKQIGELGDRFGELAEHLVAPGIIRRFNDMGYHFDDTIAERVRIPDDTGRILTEIDLLLENGNYSIAVEVKTRPKESDVEHHIRRLEILREHKDKRQDRRKIRGAIAGAVFPGPVMEAALAAGLYVIEQSGDTMKIRVPKGFIPREW